MIIKMEIPPLLKTRIRYFMAELDKDLARAPERERELRTEITRLEDLSAEINREIGYLQPHAMDSDDAAGKLYAKETRLREVTVKLLELREQIAGLKPVTLEGAGSLIDEIARHYIRHLPGKIRQTVRFISTEVNELQVTQQVSGAMRVIRQLRGWTLWIDHEKGASSYADELRAICDRVLRGQLHLGEDFKEYPPDEETATAVTIASTPVVESPPNGKIAEKPSEVMSDGLGTGSSAEIVARTKTVPEATG